MKTSNCLCLAIIAVVLLLLTLTAVYLDPELASVIGAALLGVAAIITAINRTPPAPGHSNTDDPNADEPAHPEPL